VEHFLKNVMALADFLLGGFCTSGGPFSAKSDLFWVEIFKRE
jgi:hypothetical protein